MNLSQYIFQIPKNNGNYQSVPNPGNSVGQMASFQSVGADTKKTNGYVAAVPKKIKPKSNENTAMLMKAMLLGKGQIN